MLKRILAAILACVIVASMLVSCDLGFIEEIIEGVSDAEEDEELSFKVEVEVGGTTKPSGGIFDGFFGGNGKEEPAESTAKNEENNAMRPTQSQTNKNEGNYDEPGHNGQAPTQTRPEGNGNYDEPVQSEQGPTIEYPEIEYPDTYPLSNYSLEELILKNGFESTYERYIIQYYSYKPGYCAAIIMINPMYTEKLRIDIPEIAPTGETVTDIWGMSGCLGMGVPRAIKYTDFREIINRVNTYCTDDPVSAKRFHSMWDTISIGQMSDPDEREYMLSMYPTLEDGALLYVRSDESPEATLFLRKIFDKIGYTWEEFLGYSMETLGSELEYALFENYSNIVNLTIPASVNYVDPGLLSSFTNLNSLDIRDGSTLDISDLFIKNAGNDTLTSIRIPGSVREIGDSCFKNFTKLEDVTIGVGIKSIGSNAFSGCELLNFINFKGSADEWNSIKKNRDWTGGLNIAINANDGPIQP